MKDNMSEITVLLHDDENQVALMLEFIRTLAAPGHSFDAEVDRDGDETKKFYFDGDGAFYIKEVRLNGMKVEVENDKLKENVVTEKLRQFFKPITTN